MLPDDRVRLLHMIDAADNAMGFVAGYTQAALCTGSDCLDTFLQFRLPVAVPPAPTFAASASLGAIVWSPFDYPVELDRDVTQSMGCRQSDTANIEAHAVFHAVWRH